MPSGVYGDRETARALRALANQAVPVAAIDAAARKSLQPMLAQAKQGAKATRNYAGKYPPFFPQRKGGPHLDQDLTVGKGGRQTKYRRSFLLGAKGRGRRIAHFVEFGTGAHFQPNFRGGFFHPGARAKPFMTPAYEAHGNTAISIFGEELLRQIMIKATTLYRSSRRVR